MDFKICVCLFAVVLFLSEQLVRTQIVRNPHSLDGKFTIVHSNKRLTSVTPLFVKPASSIGHCLAHCLYNKDCQSVNWNDGQKSCELLKESSTATASNLSEDVGWVFYGPEESNASAGCQTFMSGPFQDIPRKVCCPPGYYGRYCKQQQQTWEQFTSTGAVSKIDARHPTYTFGIGGSGNIWRVSKALGGDWIRFTDTDEHSYIYYHNNFIYAVRRDDYAIYKYDSSYTAIHENFVTITTGPIQKFVAVGTDWYALKQTQPTTFVYQNQNNLGGWSATSCANALSSTTVLDFDAAEDGTIYAQCSDNVLRRCKESDGVWSTIATGVFTQITYHMDFVYGIGSNQAVYRTSADRGAAWVQITVDFPISYISIDGEHLYGTNPSGLAYRIKMDGFGMNV